MQSRYINIIQQQWKQSSDRVALFEYTTKKSATYRELEEMVSAIQYHFRHHGIQMEYCESPSGIEQYFTEDVRRASFPPDGIAKIFELDIFFLIKRENEVVGYYKAVDLFFDGVIELHGSYNGPNDFLVRRYFLLSKKFVHTVQKMFPKKQIRTIIKNDNVKIVRLLQWLQFERTMEQDATSPYISYVLTDTSMLTAYEKAVHFIYAGHGK